MNIIESPEIIFKTAQLARAYRLLGIGKNIKIGDQIIYWAFKYSCILKTYKEGKLLGEYHMPYSQIFILEDTYPEDSLDLHNPEERCLCFNYEDPMKHKQISHFHIFIMCSDVFKYVELGILKPLTETEILIHQYNML